MKNLTVETGLQRMLLTIHWNLCCVQTTTNQGSGFKCAGMTLCLYVSGTLQTWPWRVQRWQQTNWYFTLTSESCNYNYAITNKSYLGECSGSVARKTCSWLPPLLFTFTLGLMPYLGLHVHVVRCWFSSLLHVVGFFSRSVVFLPLEKSNVYSLLQL